jgi:hypothetical protein
VLLNQAETGLEFKERLDIPEISSEIETPLFYGNDRKIITYIFLVKRFAEPSKPFFAFAAFNGGIGRG